MTRRQWRNPHSSLEQLLRPRHHQRHARRLGLVRPFRRPAGLHLAHRVYPQQELTVCVLTNAVDGWAHRVGRRHRAHPAGLRAQRRADAQGRRTGAGAGGACGARLDLVPMGNKVLVAAPGFAQSVARRERARGHRPQHRAHRARARLRQSRRAGALRARQVRQDHRDLACRRPLSAPAARSRAKWRARYGKPEAQSGGGERR